MSDYDNEINPGMSETKKISNDIKIPKSWKELESENAQLREELAMLEKQLEEARGIITKFLAYLGHPSKDRYSYDSPWEDVDTLARAWLAAHPEEKP